MRKLSLLLIAIIFTLVGCSKEESVRSIKKDGPNIKGIVQEVNDKSFRIQSLNRDYKGNVVVIRKVELKNGDIEFKEGDTIAVYYDKVEKGNPSVINKVYALEMIEKGEGQFIPAVVDEEGRVNNSNIDFYKFPMLTIKTNNKEVKLSEKNSAMIHDIIHNTPWEDGLAENHKVEYEIIEDGEVIATFNSKTNVLEDEQNEMYVKLHDGISELLLNSIKEDSTEGR